MERTASVLHLTNGDSAFHAMRAADIPGDILPWRDVLHEGPVPAGLSVEELAAVRAVFLADCGWAGFAHALASFRERDRRLAGLREYDEVVLWFEHDLYDQLQLIQVLDRIAEVERGATSVTMTRQPVFISQLAPDGIRRLHAGRMAVGPRELDAAVEAWAAFRSPSPEALAALAERDVPLPFLRGALVRLLEEYPAPDSGLGRTERQMLEAIASGAATPASAFSASQAREEAVFMGDATFWQRMDALLRGARPLLEWATLPPPDFPPATFDDRRFFDRGMRLTDAGRAALDGRLDHAAVNGLDRWTGGVRLMPGHVWRYDANAHRLIDPRS